ncbi:mas-related G-protein coupled receptor member H-like [Heteronotia binoei]|uniref:mas-related G-protein coupled receptor member H-like n=1 Tax=Heteronotia binoei TaxID=13085 RepID=UPI0029303F7B|nr:mas-related G-protein coupled receptor member H-like [Heteronotia binoei]
MRVHLSAIPEDGGLITGWAIDRRHLNNCDIILNVADLNTVTPTVEQGKNITLNVTEDSDGSFSYLTLCIQILYIIMLLFCLWGLVGNVKVVWILSCCVKRNPFATYILNLAVAEVGTLLSELADDINMALVLFDNAFHGRFDIIFLLEDVLIFFTYSASLYLLTAVSLETVLSVLFPVWYQFRRSGKSSAVVCCLLWILSGLLSGILLSCHLQGAYCGMIVNTICIVNFLICAPLVILSVLTVVVTVCCNSRRRETPRLYVTILITVSVFIIFGIPLSVLNLSFFSADDLPLGALETSYVLAYSISSINPLIYKLAGRDEKRRSGKSLKVVLRRLFKDEAEAREELSKGNKQAVKS